jgi:hypothetical protein
MHNAMQQIVETYSEAMQHTMDTRGASLQKTNAHPLLLSFFFGNN